MEERKLIYERISAVMAEIDAIAKDQVNQQQRFKYRSIDDVYNALSKVMAKHQVFSTVEILSKERTTIQSKSGGAGFHLVVSFRFTFHTIDGSSLAHYVDGEAQDYGDKASNKALSIAHKYALLTLFCIPTVETKDPDKFTPEAKKEDEQPKEKLPAHIQIIKAFRAYGVTEDDLTIYAGCDINDNTPKHKIDLLRTAFVRIRSGEAPENVFNDLKATPNVNDLF